jgi:hypothetical protein
MIIVRKYTNIYSLSRRKGMEGGKGQRAEDRGRRSEVRRQLAVDSRQQAEDRRRPQRSEVRSQKSEERIKNKEEMDSPVGAAFPNLSLSKVSRDLAL